MQPLGSNQTTTCDSPVKKSKIVSLCISFASLCLKCRIAELPLRAGLMCFVDARTSSESNGRSVIWRFERSDAIETCNGMIFNFYTGLPHTYVSTKTAEGGK